MPDDVKTETTLDVAELIELKSNLIETLARVDRMLREKGDGGDPVPFQRTIPWPELLDDIHDDGELGFPVVLH